MKRLAHDSLTHSYSREGLPQYIEHFLRESQQTVQPFSLAMIDLDHFKSINDAFGHARGDEVLRHVAERIQSAIRDQDLLFRYGGDEFVLLLPACDKAEAVQIAKRILSRVDETPFSGDPPISLSLSQGVATFPEDADGPETLFEKADARAYMSKRHGRGRIISQDLGAQPGLHFDDSGRLIGRDVALEQVQEFLVALQEARRGLLELAGPEGVGASRFLREVARTASLQRFAVLSLSGSEALASRLLGALGEGRFEGAHLNARDPTQIREEIARHLRITGKVGVLVTLDRPGGLDPHSLHFVDRLLASDLPAVGVVVGTGSLAPPFPDLPLGRRTRLEPFSPDEVALWLRSVLRLDPPEAFVNRLHEETGGLPANLQAGLLELHEAGLLEAGENGWTLYDAPTFGLGEHILSRRRPAPQALPAWDTLFVGRGKELRGLRERLRRNRLVTLLGEGGTGKSRLAVQLGRELLPEFPGGVYFVSLAELRESRLIVQRVAQVLGEVLPLPLSGVNDPLDALASALADKELLLILDNFEHLLDGAEALERLQEHLPGLRLLVTSREALRLKIESPYPLTGLDLPETTDTPGFENCGAVQLFLNRIQQTKHHETHERETTGAQAEVANEALLRICQLTGGMPLALELAAAWTPVLSCELIAQELDKGLAFLQAAPGQEGRLWGVFDTFWKLLSDTEQETLSRLALFRGGFSAEAARQVAGASLFFLLALSDRAFLNLTEGRRFRMHELLRQIALAKLADPETARARFVRYFSEQASRHERTLDKTKEAYGFVDTEFSNFWEAWHWACRAEDAMLLQPMAELLRGYCDVRGKVQEGLELFAEAERALEGAGGEARLTLGWALESQALFHTLMRHFEQARRLAERGLELLAPLGPSEALALCHNTLGMISGQQGDNAAARTHFVRAKDIHEGLDNRMGVAQMLGNIATATDRLGDKTQALEEYQAALALKRELNISSGVAVALFNLGQLHLDLEDRDAARTHFEEALNVAREIGYSLVTANALEQLGELAHHARALDEAVGHFEEALELFEKMGNLGRRAAVRTSLARTLLAQDRLREAEAQLDAALATAEAEGQDETLHEGLLLLAALHLAKKEPLEAARALGYLQGRDTLSATQQQGVSNLLGDLKGLLSEATLSLMLKQGRALTAEALIHGEVHHLPA